MSSSSDDGESHSPVNVVDFAGPLKHSGKDSKDLVSNAMREILDHSATVDQSDEQKKADFLRFHTKGVVPGKTSLILVDNEVPERARMLCIVNAQKSTVMFFNGEYCSSSIVTHELSLHSHASSVGRFATALHKLSADQPGKAAKISGLSCRVIESPRGSGDFALNVRLLYYNELGQISQMAAWAQLRKWRDNDEKKDELAAWGEETGISMESVLSEVETLSSQSNVIFIRSLKDNNHLFEGCRTLVHFKGFSSNFDKNCAPSEEMMNQLCASDVIVFDGDNYGTFSFTRVIRMVYESASRNGQRVPLFVAFRYESSKEEFQESWQKVAGIEIICCLVGDDLVHETKYFDPGANSSIGKSYTRKSGQDKYAALGVFAVECTRNILYPLKRSVVVWGGSNTVLQEFQVGLNLFGVPAPRWIYYGASRVHPGNQVEYGALETVEHDKLEKRQ